MRFITVFLIIASPLLFASAFSQVVNNEIDQRVKLTINQLPYSSTTANSTVEAGCINQVLTKACLIYHNDQWFTFTVPEDGKYYLNVSDQRCKKKMGIQVLLIEGDPCVITSYKMRRCIPKLAQGDTYVSLDSLRSDVPYLLNIDGFLGDYCSFSIQVADHAAGLPEKELEYVDSHSDIELADSIVTITTQLSPEDARKTFQIRVYRRYLDGPLALLDSIMPERLNALGEFVTGYSLRDTLRSIGEYTYKVYGVQHDSGELLVLGEKQLMNMGKENPEGVFSVELPRGVSRNKPVNVRLIYPPTGKVLESYTRRMEYKNDKVRIDFSKYAAAGFRDFVLELSNEGSEKTEAMFFRVSDDGRMQRR